MSYGYRFNAYEDKLEFGSGLHINIIYGIFDSEDQEFYEAWDMFTAPHRQIKLLGNENKVLNETIEDNPYKTELDIGGFKELAEAEIRDGVL